MICVDGFLNGHLLIAMPTMTQARYDQAIVLVCGHDESGAIGLIVNKPLPGVSLGDLFQQMGIKPTLSVKKQPTYYGGPQDVGKGFVLHDRSFYSKNSVPITDEFAVTATFDVLAAINEGIGPKNYRVGLGYINWSKGELEKQIAQHHWLIGIAHKTVIFDVEPSLQWQIVLNKNGFDKNYVPIYTGNS